MVKSLHEDKLGVLNNVLDVIDKGFDAIGGNRAAQRKNSNTLNVSSISRASKDLIMSFPVLCDNSIEPRTAAMICKAVERKAVAMLQMLFASCAFYGSNGREILANWHSNMDSSSLSMDDYLALCDKLESAAETPSEKRAINEAVSIMKQQLKTPQKSYPVSSISEHAVSDYRVSVKYGKTLVTEATAAEVNDAKARMYDAQARRANAEADKADKEAKGVDHKNMMAPYKDSLDMGKTGSDIFKAQLLDSDVKKCNELVPSLMVVRFNAKVNDGKDATYVPEEFIAGVKARLIPVDSLEIADKIRDKNKDGSGFMKFIRATTGEIGLVKDYLLALNKSKADAQKNSKRTGSSTSRIWKNLEKRATQSVWRRLRRKTNDAGCITTLVISSELANMLKKEGIDIANVKTAANFMDSYNLLCLVIVDESTEVARFLYDGDDSFEDLSFSSLERESGDGSYKKVINLLSKINK